MRRSVDLVLRDVPPRAVMPQAHLLGLGPGMVEHRGVDQIIVEHQIGLAEQFDRGRANKPGSPGPAPTRETLPIMGIILAEKRPLGKLTAGLPSAICCAGR